MKILKLSLGILAFVLIVMSNAFADPIFPTISAGDPFSGIFSINPLSAANQTRGLNDVYSPLSNKPRSLYSDHRRRHVCGTC
jgi:hypothetical protein